MAGRGGGPWRSGGRPAVLTGGGCWPGGHIAPTGHVVAAAAAITGARSYFACAPPHTSALRLEPPSARYKDRTSDESRAARVLHGTFGNVWESAEIRRFLWERVAK